MQEREREREKRTRSCLRPKNVLEREAQVRIVLCLSLSLSSGSAASFSSFSFIPQKFTWEVYPRTHSWREREKLKVSCSKTSVASGVTPETSFTWHSSFALQSVSRWSQSVCLESQSLPCFLFLPSLLLLCPHICCVRDERSSSLFSQHLTVCKLIPSLLIFFTRDKFWLHLHLRQKHSAPSSTLNKSIIDINRKDNNNNRQFVHSSRERNRYSFSGVFQSPCLLSQVLLNLWLLSPVRDSS